MFQQLPGAMAAVNGLEYELLNRVTTAASQPLPSSPREILFKRADPTPLEFRIMLHHQSIPEVTRLYEVEEISKCGGEYYVKAVVFNSAIKTDTPSGGKHPIQGLIRKHYTWPQFKAIKFEHTAKYEEEFDKAKSLLEGLQNSDQGLHNSDKTWVGTCLPFFPSCWEFFRYYLLE